MRFNDNSDRILKEAHYQNAIWNMISVTYDGTIEDPKKRLIVECPWDNDVSNSIIETVLPEDNDVTPMVDAMMLKKNDVLRRGEKKCEFESRVAAGKFVRGKKDDIAYAKKLFEMSQRG